MEKRLQYIDILKVIATVMIVSIHFSVSGKTIDYNSVNILGIIKKLFVDIEAIGVPLFFMINGL